MQRIEHMKASEDELIAHIKESLAGHEEPYVPGAWERFNKGEEKKSNLMLWVWRFSAAAAVLVIGTGLFLFISRTPDPLPVQIVKQKPGQTAPSAADKGGTVLASPIIADERISANNNPAAYNKGKAIAKITQDVSNEIAVAVPNAAATQPSAAGSKSEVTAANVAPETIPAGDKPSVFQEFLDSETKKNKEGQMAQASAAKKSNKWEMGLVVAPSFGNTKKLNMGYGVSMGYALTDRISLNSGISYNEMAASKSLPVPVNTAIAGGGKNLESIEAKVTGIDIPLEFKYHLSKNLYANVGVSAFAVIDQKQSNSYIEGRLVERAVNTAGGKEELKTFAINQRVVEEAPESEIKDGRYIGFYNFSFGYKQKISKDRSVSIEPFMKVPMKEVSEENLRLIGTGVRLKFDF